MLIIIKYIHSLKRRKLILEVILCSLQLLLSSDAFLYHINFLANLGKTVVVVILFYLLLVSFYTWVVQYACVVCFNNHLQKGTPIGCAFPLFINFFLLLNNLLMQIVIILKNSHFLFLQFCLTIVVLLMSFL